MFQSPGKIAISIGNIDIHWYGITMCLGFLSAIFITLKIAGFKNYTKEQKENLLDLSSILLLFGIIGARLYYVIFNWGYYQNNISEIIQINKGGLSIHGALFLGLLATFVYSRIKQINFLELLDIFSPGMALGQAIGRWGNFFNSEAFGLPTNSILKLFIPIENRPENYLNYEYFHPTFLYESMLDLVLFILLFYLIKSNKACNNGQVFAIYLLVYSAIRFCIEQIRIDSVASLLGLPIAQFVSIILILTSLIMLYYVTVLKKSVDTP